MTTHGAMVPGRRWELARVGWLLAALIILGLDAVGIPYAYDSYQRVCTRNAAQCDATDQLRPQHAQQLQTIGLTTGDYAALRIAQETVFTLICCAVAAVIVARRANEPMALFTAFVLLVFGGAGAAGTMRGLMDVHGAFWFPINVLDYLSQVSFGVLFFVFPNGRFVPRWTRAVAAASAVFFVLDIFLTERFWKHGLIRSLLCTPPACLWHNCIATDG